MGYSLDISATSTNLRCGVQEIQETSIDNSLSPIPHTRIMFYCRFFSLSAMIDLWKWCLFFFRSLCSQTWCLYPTPKTVTPPWYVPWHYIVAQCVKVLWVCFSRPSRVCTIGESLQSSLCITVLNILHTEWVSGCILWQMVFVFVVQYFYGRHQSIGQSFTWWIISFAAYFQSCIWNSCNITRVRTCTIVFGVRCLLCNSVLYECFVVLRGVTQGVVLSFTVLVCFLYTQPYSSFICSQSDVIMVWRSSLYAIARMPRQLRPSVCLSVARVLWLKKAEHNRNSFTIWYSNSSFSASRVVA